MNILGDLKPVTKKDKHKFDNAKPTKPKFVNVVLVKNK